MHMTPRLIGPVWTQPDGLPDDAPDASDASHAFQQLGAMHHTDSDLGMESFHKPGFEFAPYHANLDYSIGKGYGSQDQRFHTQGDSYAEADTDGTMTKKVQDPVSVLPSHLYSTDDEQSTQHAISGSNSAQMQPQVSMQTSAKDISLHLPSISDIYAVIDENQKALAVSEAPAKSNLASKHGISTPLSAVEATRPVRGSPMETIYSNTSPPNLNVSCRPAVTANLFTHQNGYNAQHTNMGAGAASLLLQDGLAYGRAGELRMHGDCEIIAMDHLAALPQSHDNHAWHCAISEKPMRFDTSTQMSSLQQFTSENCCSDNAFGDN